MFEKFFKKRSVESDFNDPLASIAKEFIPNRDREEAKELLMSLLGKIVAIDRYMLIEENNEVTFQGNSQKVTFGDFDYGRRKIIEIHSTNNSLETVVRFYIISNLMFDPELEFIGTTMSRGDWSLTYLNEIGEEVFGSTFEYTLRTSRFTLCFGTFSLKETTPKLTRNTEFENALLKMKDDDVSVFHFQSAYKFFRRYFTSKKVKLEAFCLSFSEINEKYVWYAKVYGNEVIAYSERKDEVKMSFSTKSSSYKSDITRLEIGEECEFWTKAADPISEMLNAMKKIENFKHAAKKQIDEE